jgi:hypothetical protein
MTPALKFGLGMLLILLGVDAIFWAGLLPGGTISDAISNFALTHPIAGHGVYLAVCALHYWHFFVQRKSLG